MRAGDRVKLKPHIAKTFAAKSKQIDWTTRLGDVAVIRRTAVGVKWDDRSSLDEWPETALMVVERN